MKKILIPLIILSVLILAGCLKKAKEGAETAASQMVSAAAINAKAKAERDLAIAQAKIIFQQKKALDEDFSSGPCLSNEAIKDWVADIAHNPRQPIDDLPTNQCSAYRQGQAHHFVELDPGGQSDQDSIKSL